MMQDFLCLQHFTKEHLYEIINTADKIKSGKLKLLKLLNNKKILTIFPESSLRTRITFEIAVKSLGALHVPLQPTCLEKKEPIKDIANYLDCWINMLIIRYPKFSIVQEIAEYLNAPILSSLSVQEAQIAAEWQCLQAASLSLEDLAGSRVGPHPQTAGEEVAVALAEQEQVLEAEDWRRVSRDLACF